MPYLVELSGKIVGVGFEPGTNTVKIKSDDGRHFTFLASPLHINNALDLRSLPIKVLAVMQENGCRLLRLQEAGMPWPIPSREDSIFNKWDGLLRRLAQC